MTLEAPRVVVRCDVGPSVGIGHLMRCVALSEEFLERGFEVVFAADVGRVPWAAAQLERRGMLAVAAPSTPEDHIALLTRLRAEIVVIDSYLLGPEVYSAVRAAGYPLLALVDGDIEGREADVYVDQNIGAEDEDWPRPAGSLRLAGLAYALMRNDILDHRVEQTSRGHGRPPKVLAFFGGTDAFRVAPRVSAALASTGRPFRASVVCTTPEAAEEVRAVELTDDQLIEPIEPADRLAELVVRADLVVSAAGTSSWELLCLGAAAGLLCVADNQATSYQRIIDLGCVTGLGTAAELAENLAPAASAMDRLLADEPLRGELAERGRSLVDGRGRVRVVAALLDRCRARPAWEETIRRQQSVF